MEVTPNPQQIKLAKIRVPFYDFIDYALKNGKAKDTVIRRIKSQDEYHPGKDFYLHLRREIVRKHKAGEPISSIDLEELTKGLKDHRRIKAYPPLVDAYAGWLYGKELSWFNAPKGLWRFGGLEVPVNPNFGLVIDGVPHLIRLHFSKGKKMDERYGELMANLMRYTISDAPEGCRMAVLDVRRATLYEETSMSPPVVHMLEREAQNWLAGWERV